MHQRPSATKNKQTFFKNKKKEKKSERAIEVYQSTSTAMCGHSGHDVAPVSNIYGKTGNLNTKNVSY